DEQIRSQAALLDISGDAIYVRNFSNRIIYWNEGAHRLYGWAAADACGKTINELDLTVDPRESAIALKAAQEHEKWAGEMRQKSRDGREWIVQSRWTLKVFSVSPGYMDTPLSQQWDARLRELIRANSERITIPTTAAARILELVGDSNTSG